jgi:hypothetical protein
MELSTDYLNKFNPALKLRKQTKEQALAEEIWLHFNKQLGFPMLMGLIKRQGAQAIREFFYESIKSDHPDHLALFMWKVGKNKIVWYN